MDKELLEEISRLSNRPVPTITPDLRLGEDLGLDSLDITELLVLIEHKFHKNVSFELLQTVEDILLAAKGEKGLLPAMEAARLLERWRQETGRKNIEIPKAHTIPEAFLLSCERMGSALACSDPLMTISYQRLKSLVLGLTEHFKTLPAKHVGVFLPSSIYLNCVVLALLMVQKVPVMLNWTLGPKHLEEALYAAEIETVLSSERFVASASFEIPPILRAKLLFLEKILDRLSFASRTEALELARKNTKEILFHFGLESQSGEETAVLLFTSGTELTPKGVPLSHLNLLSNQRDALERAKLTPQDVIIGMLPAFHVFGLSLTNLMPLLAGLKAVYWPSPLDVGGIAKQIEQKKVTMLCGTPTFTKMLLNAADPKQLGSVRLFIVGAEAAPESLFRQVEALQNKSQVLEGYGLTETSPILTLNHPHSSRQGVGLPLAQVELQILDPETKEPVLRGKEGMVVAHGPNVFKGYLNSKIHPFVNLKGKQWFMTQDIGHLDEKGALHLSGRLSRFVKIGGEMVSLSLIEKILREGLRIPLAVLGKEREKRTHLVLIATEKIEIKNANALLHTAGLSNLLRIKEVHYLPELPLLASGKIDYKRLESKA